MKKINLPIIVISMVVVFILIGLMYVYPAQTSEVANGIFSWMTKVFGSATLWFGFLGVILLTGVAISKYGNIKLGDGDPEFSNFKWISMMIACGLGSATVYWAFAEWAFYIETPGLSIIPQSVEAFEMAVPYTMFHWGFTAWTLYALVGIPLCYHFYIRKNPGLSLSSMITKTFNLKENGIVAKIIDIMFIFICFGGLSITLGVSVPLVSQVLSEVVGVEPTFRMNIILIVIISVVYSLSSYVGLEKGMSMISNMTTKLAIVLIGLILILGPTIFIIDNTTNSMGLMIQNFVEMSLFTDPVNQSGFPQAWTMFYWLYWITYAPFTGVFIAKVSKGRTLREVIINTLVSGSAGCFAFFGIIGSFSVERQLNGAVDMVSMVNSGQSNEGVIELLKTLPFSGLIMILFCVVSVLFLATTLDGSALTMATTATPGLKEGENPHPLHRLFWCVMLALVPLTMILIGADLNTIKTAAIITGVPIIFVMLMLIYGWLKWMMEDNKNGRLEI